MQLYVQKSGSDNTIFYSRGINQETEATITNTPGQSINCLYNQSYWRDNNNQVENFTLKVQTQIDPIGTVCFSKDTRYFLKEGKLSKQLNVSIEGRLTNNYIIICTTENANKSGGKCATTQADGLEKPAYLVEWNRFGNISKFKWGGSAWNRL